DETAAFIAYAGIAHFVLDGISQLDIADGAGRLLDKAGYALVALAAQPGRPVDRRAFSRPTGPLSADFCEVGGEYIGCAASVRPVGDENSCAGQRNTGIDVNEPRIVPFSDPA